MIPTTRYDPSRPGVTKQADHGFRGIRPPAAGRSGPLRALPLHEPGGAHSTARAEMPGAALPWGDTTGRTVTGAPCLGGDCRCARSERCCGYTSPVDSESGKLPAAWAYPTAVRIGRQDAEVSVPDVAKVQVRRRRRDAHVRIGGIALPRAACTARPAWATRAARTARSHPVKRWKMWTPG